MLSLFTRQGRVIVKAVLSGNYSARQFLALKLAFIALGCAAIAFGWLWLMIVLWAMSELSLAWQEDRRQEREGFTQARARRVMAVRLATGAAFGLIGGAALNWLPLWAALPVALLSLLVSFGAYIILRLKLLFNEMRGTAPTENSVLFQQVRQMHDLEQVVSQLEARLLTSRDLDQRRDLTFYLGWAEIFRGHSRLSLELWDKASLYYKAALKRDPANQSARAALTIAYLRQNEFELALGEIERAVAVFNGQPAFTKYDEALWHWHRNEVSSVYEQSAGLFQLCALAIGLVQQSDLSGAAKELFVREFTTQMRHIPDRSREELWWLMSRKGGTSLGALQVMCAGPFRAPANPLDLLVEAVTLPLLPIQTIEEIAA